MRSVQTIAGAGQFTAASNTTGLIQLSGTGTKYARFCAIGFTTTVACTMRLTMGPVGGAATEVVTLIDDVVATSFKACLCVPADWELKFTTTGKTATGSLVAAWEVGA